MKFSETRIGGAFLVDLEPIEDERGFFARSWCSREFQEMGLDHRLAQCSISFNKKRGTLRGMHYQTEPHAEGKLVRCTAGEIFDVIVDLRPGSPTFKDWVSVVMSAENRRMIYVPPGVAHGFQSLVDATEVFYQVSEAYRSELARSVRWNDPAFGIEWPQIEARVISERDRQVLDFAG